VWRSSMETQQSGHAPRSGPEVKNRRSAVKDGTLRNSNQDNPDRGELDPAYEISRRCKKNSHSVLFCIRGQKKAVMVAAKSGQFIAGKTGERQVPLRKKEESGRRKSCEKYFVSRSFSGYALSVLGEGECCSGFGERVCQLVTEKSRVPGTHWKLRTGVEEVPNIPEGFWLKKAGAVERRARADWESVWKRAN